MMLQYSVLKKVWTELPPSTFAWLIKKNRMQTFAHQSQSGSNNDLWRLQVSQWLLILQGISICLGFLKGCCYPGRAEWYVPEPGEGWKVSTDAKWKIVDLPALQGEAEMTLMGFVPGQDASLMLWSCDIHVKVINHSTTTHWIKLIEVMKYLGLCCQV